MKLFISSLPINPWWGEGTPQYVDNPAMREGVIPNQSLLEKEWEQLRQTLASLPVDFEVLPFPGQLDSGKASSWKHDFVFLRDLFLSNRKGDVVVARFQEKEREAEIGVIEKWLDQKQVNVHKLPQTEDYYMEGGEFYYCQNENILFAGESRNSPRGNEKTAEYLNVAELIVLKSTAFHLDTIISPVFNVHNELCFLIACLELLENDSRIRLQEFSKKRGIPLIAIPPEEAIGTQAELGSFAVNCMPLPGSLVGSAEFKTQQVNDALKENNIKHLVVPLTQFRLSGGSVHCLTNTL